jgi:hypothetical protein
VYPASDHFQKKLKGTHEERPKKFSHVRITLITLYTQNGANPYRIWVCAGFASKLEIEGKQIHR